MSQLTELAERYGLVSPEAIAELVPRLPKKRFFKLVEETCQAVAIDANKLTRESASTPSLLASSSFRSDSGCRDWPCRAGKLASLAQYAALYSDRLVVPIHFEWFTAGLESGRLAIGDLYFKHFVLRPLVEAGITKFAVDLFCLCAECGKRFRAICAMHEKAAFELWVSKIPEMNVVYRPPRPGRPWFVEISGPDGYVPHGSLHLVPVGAVEAPDWAPKRVGVIGGEPGAILSAQRIKANRIGARLFAELSKDAVFQQYHGIRFGANYITDSPIEAAFLNRVYPRDDLSESIRVLLAELTSNVPLLADVPLRTIMKIRENDYDSFLVYRSALRDVLNKYVKVGCALSSDEAKQICADLIAPQLAKLRIDANAKRRSIVRRSLAKSVVPVAMISVGVIAGLIPHELGEIFKWGGIALSGQIAEALASIEKNPAEIRSHNFYFLYRLSQEAA